MLAPPNEGSEVVDRLRGWKLFQMINGPAGLELGTGLADGPRALGPLPAGVLVGVIAGDRTLNPFFSALSRRNDGKVAVAATHVAGETDHVTLPATHTWIIGAAMRSSRWRHFCGMAISPEIQHHMMENDTSLVVYYQWPTSSPFVENPASGGE